MTSEREFIEIIKTHEPIIYKACYLFAHRNPEVVRDLYQEVVCALWQSRWRFRGESSIATWVYRVSVNTVVNYHKKHSKEISTAPLSDHLSDTLPNTDDQELVDHLYELITQLPAKEQKLVYLYLEGLSPLEIAQTIGISYNNVRVKLHRIKQKLRLEAHL